MWPRDGRAEHTRSLTLLGWPGRAGTERGRAERGETTGLSPLLHSVHTAAPQDLMSFNYLGSNFTLERTWTQNCAEAHPVLPARPGGRWDEESWGWPRAQPRSHLTPITVVTSPFSVWVAQLLTGGQNTDGAFWAAWRHVRVTQWVATVTRLIINTRLLLCWLGQVLQCGEIKLRNCEGTNKTETFLGHIITITCAIH